MIQTDKTCFAAVGDITNSHSDVALVELAKAGDHAAYVELCRRHSSMASRAILRITKNHEDMEDALQEALMRALMHIDTFDGRSAFSTWLTRIGVNCALMHLRKKRVRRESSIDQGNDENSWQVPQIADPSPDPEKYYFQCETKARLRNAIGRLPSSLRGAIEIRYAQEASLKEVAACMDISLSAAKSRLLRANVRLRKSITYTCCR